MSRTWLLLALLAPAAVMSLSAARADDDPRARKMMEEAFNRRYRWNESFKGFSADFSFTRAGKTVKGTIKADATKPHGGVSVECDDADVKKLVSETRRQHGHSHSRFQLREGIRLSLLRDCRRGCSRRYQDRDHRPWLLQGLHGQGRQHHREPWRPRPDVHRGQGSANRLACRNRQDASSRVCLRDQEWRSGTIGQEHGNVARDRRGMAAHPMAPRAE